jgi:hypothetical protein
MRFDRWMSICGFLETVPTNLFVGNVLFLKKKENSNGHVVHGVQETFPTNTFVGTVFFFKKKIVIATETLLYHQCCNCVLPNIINAAVLLSFLT